MFGLSLFHPNRQSNPSQRPSHVRQRKIQISPPPGEPDWSNALPQGQQGQSNPHPTPCLPPPAGFTLIGAYLQFSMYKPLGSLYLEGRFNREFFALLVWGAYIWRGVHVFSDFYGIHMYICAYMKRQKTSQIPLKAIIASFEAFAREKSSCCYLSCMGLYVTKSGMLPERPKESAQKLLKTFLSHCFSKCTQCLDQE